MTGTAGLKFNFHREQSTQSKAACRNNNNKTPLTCLKEDYMDAPVLTITKRNFHRREARYILQPHTKVLVCSHVSQRARTRRSTDTCCCCTGRVPCWRWGSEAPGPKLPLLYSGRWLSAGSVGCGRSEGCVCHSAWVLRLVLSMPVPHFQWIIHPFLWRFTSSSGVWGCCLMFCRLK